MRWLLTILCVLLLVPGWTGEPRRPILGAAPNLRMTPVALDTDHPGRRRVGDLEWLGGVQLTSTDRAFGGFSALTISGTRFTLLSDFGATVSFDMPQPGSFAALRFGSLADGPGDGWIKRDRDSESLTVDPRDGSMWIGFENYNALWHYAPGPGAALEHVVPPAMAAWPENEGPEAMAAIRGLGLVVLAESTPLAGHPGTRLGIVFTGDPVRQPNRGFTFGLRTAPGYDPSDVAVLPNGDLLVLTRGFGWRDGFTAKLLLVARSAIRRGAVVTGTEIATLAAPLIHDNFEGLAVAQEGPATIVWLVSDDNQTLFQRTLLLKFRLVG